MIFLLSLAVSCEDAGSEASREEEWEDRLFDMFNPKGPEVGGFWVCPISVQDVHAGGLGLSAQDTFAFA